MKNCCLVVIAFSTLLGCATTSRQLVENVKKEVAAQNYQAALVLVDSEKFYPEERSHLLKLLERGMLLYRLGNYYQSLQVFDQAKDLSDKLYTTSISKKLAAAVSNANADNYYGERYERSLIRFYQALNHYQLFQSGVYQGGQEQTDKILSSQERQRHLSGARATIVEWDSLLKNYQADQDGASVYKNDMSAKIVGAIIHQQFGSSGELQIAQQLYKDAAKLLIRNYNAYPTFNVLSEKFRKDFSKFPEMGEEKVLKDYVSSTPHSLKLSEFLKQQLKTIKRKQKVMVVVSNGLIAAKKARKIDFPIPMMDLPDIPSGGDMGFGTFIRKVLSAAQGTAPSISFELPEVEKKDTPYFMKLVVKDQQGKEVAAADLALINPLSDMAFEALDEKIAATYAKIGARVALKHITALVSAYATYKAAAHAGNSALAFFSATMLYAGSNKAIAASEQADLRYWSTLPHDVRLALLDLKPGKYQFFLQRTDRYNNSQMVTLGERQIKQANHSWLLDFSVF